MKRMLWSLLAAVMIFTLFGLGDKGRFVHGAAGNEYAYTDQVTKMKVEPMDFTEYEYVNVGGGYIIWLLHEDYAQNIFALNLQNGEVLQLTNDKSNKGEPVAAQTTQGTLVVWTQSYPGAGSEVWSSHLTTKEMKKLASSNKKSYQKPTVDGNYMAWEERGTRVVHLLDLTTGAAEAVGEGTDPQLKNNVLFYREGRYKLIAYVPKTGIKQEMAGVSSSTIGLFATNGKQIVAETKYSNTASQYKWLNASQPEEYGTALVKDRLPAFKMFAGQSYGAWVEMGEQDRTHITVVDLLYKDTFEMPIDVNYHRVIGFSGDKLVYLSKDGIVVLRSFQPPAARAVRDVEPIQIIMDGDEIEQRVPPMIIKGSTYVEFRTIFEKMGFRIKWDGQTRTITGTKDNTEIKLTIDRKEIMVNGKAVKTAQAPIIRGGTTYVPLRLIGEAADRIVTWNGKKRIVFIRPKDTDDTLYFEDGTVKYHGDLVNGLREGYGTLYHDNGRVQYIGEWKNDKMHGKGQMYYLFTDEVFFEGIMENGNMVEGVEYYPGGAIRYQGTYHRTASHWEGTEVRFNSEGEVLIVQIREGRMNGEATWFYADGSVMIEGIYLDDRFIEGTLYDPEGNVLHIGEFDTFGEPIRAAS